MHIKKYAAASLAALLTALFVSCASAPRTSGTGSAVVSPEVHALVQNAVFEVLVKKPVADSLAYDKELDWSVVPYVIRQDSYYSIGTAFAVSKTDLVTAFHVINLGEESDIFGEYFVRDTKGNVYEVDKITRGSNERDFIQFTVKDKTFDRYFEFQRDFAVGSPVFSVGNALGEGIVMRNGLVIGTIPEPESGRWSKLKSSADGNPGNSGGPLITPSGKVVGIVIELNDNILYSLPAQAMLDTEKPDTLHYRLKLTYGHLLLSNQITRTFETDVNLPADYRSVRKDVTETYEAKYGPIMEELFAAAPEYLSGPNNAYLLNSVADTSFPQLAFVDKDDNQWTLSSLKVSRSALPNDGSIDQAVVNDHAFLKVNLPKDVKMSDIASDPKALMDLILQGISIQRSLGGAEKYRITSLGKPSYVGEYRDRMGRLWMQANWTIEFEDKTLIAFILPTPNGPVMFWTSQGSARKAMYEWDLKATCDRLVIAYSGKFPEWQQFLTMTKWLPPFLKDVNFTWSEGLKVMSLKSPALSVTAGPEVFEWAPSSSMFLSPAHYREGAEIKYGVRKLILQRDVQGNDFVILFKHTKPDPILGEKNEEAWEELLQAKAPFDEIPGIDAKAKTGAIGALMNAEKSSEDTRYTLYLGMANAGDEASLAKRFKSLKGGMQITQ